MTTIIYVMFKSQDLDKNMHLYGIFYSHSSKNTYLCLSELNDDLMKSKTFKSDKSNYELTYYFIGNWKTLQSLTGIGAANTEVLF